MIAPARTTLGLIKQATRHLVDARCLAFHGGVGDQLLLTIVAREFKKRGVKSVFVVSKNRDLFSHNKDVSLVADPGSSLQNLCIKLAGYDRSYAPRYDLEHDFANDVGKPPGEHIAAVMCRASGISGDIEIRPYLKLTEAERRSNDAFDGAIAVQSGVMNAASPIPNKEWLPGRFDRVAETLLKDHPVVQLGGLLDPPLPCTNDLRGKTSIRESAGILSRSRLFVGHVGFLMHLARAVDCPAVVIYGGRERPDQSGYSCNENLYSDIECAPCWNYSRCDFGRVCMKMIEVDHVLDAVARMLERPRSPLPVDRYRIA